MEIMKLKLSIDPKCKENSNEEVKEKESVKILRKDY